MTINHACAMLFILLAAVVAGCNRSSGLKGQSNTTLPFYGKVVDQVGKPLAGVAFDFRVESYPNGWTFDTRGRDNDVHHVTATSDAQGGFSFTVSGCQMFRMRAEKQGYRHFEDTDSSSESVDNRFYRLIAWSDPWYKTDPDHPAVYVFVKDGSREVSVLPSRGGYDSGGGKQWRPNQPGWPKNPSLKDVVYKNPTTVPSGMHEGVPLWPPPVVLPPTTTNASEQQSIQWSPPEGGQGATTPTLSNAKKR